MKEDRFSPSLVLEFSRLQARGRLLTTEWSSWTTSRREKYQAGTLEPHLRHSDRDNSHI